MLAFVDGLDFVVLLNWEELGRLEKGKVLESPLMVKGEIPTGKSLRIIFSPEAEELVSKRYVPESPGWEKLETVVLTINQIGLNRIFKSGQGICHAGDLNSDFLIKYEPAA